MSAGSARLEVLATTWCVVLHKRQAAAASYRYSTRVKEDDQQVHEEAPRYPTDGPFISRELEVKVCSTKRSYKYLEKYVRPTSSCSVIREGILTSK